MDPCVPHIKGCLFLSQCPDGPDICWSFTGILNFLSSVLKKMPFLRQLRNPLFSFFCLAFLFLTHHVAWRLQGTDSQRKISLLPRLIIYRMALLTSCVFHFIYSLFFKSDPSRRKCSAPRSCDGGTLLRVPFRGQGPGARRSFPSAPKEAENKGEERKGR